MSEINDIWLDIAKNGTLYFLLQHTAISVEWMYLSAPVKHARERAGLLAGMDLQRYADVVCSAAHPHLDHYSADGMSADVPLAAYSIIPLS